MLYDAVTENGWSRVRVSRLPPVDEENEDRHKLTVSWLMKLLLDCIQSQIPAHNRCIAVILIVMVISIISYHHVVHGRAVCL